MKNFIYILLAALFIISCEREKKDPIVTTTLATGISACTGKAVARIDERGSYTITNYGFICYFSTSENIPYLPDSVNISLGKTVTADTFDATFALRNTVFNRSGDYKWYVRSYITNEKGTVYGNAISFAPLALTLSKILPASAKAGDTIVIYGNNFDNTASNNKVGFINNNFTFATVVSATKTELRIIVPALPDPGYYGSLFDITVTTGTQNATLNDVFTPIFSVYSFSPKTGTFGNIIYIYGANLGQVNGVVLGNVPASFNTYSGYLSFIIPNYIAAKKFKIYVAKNGVQTEVPGDEFTMNNLAANLFSPTKVSTGSSLTIYGNYFNSNPYNMIFIGSEKILPSSSYPTYISGNIPSMASGDYKVSVSNGLDTVTAPGTLKIISPTITGLSPSSGYIGTELVISGHNLNYCSSNVYFNGYYNTSYYTDSTTYKVKIPSLVPGTYKVWLFNGNVRYYSPTDFTIMEPKLTSITPASDAGGTAFVITGEGFSTYSSDVHVKFGNTYATIVSVNNTQINGIVPSSLSKGTWMVIVTVNGITLTNSLTFTIP